MKACGLYIHKKEIENPEPLLDQLEEGGRMIIPIGDQALQELTKITKEDGTVRMKKLGGCRFVPLRGEYGW